MESRFERLKKSLIPAVLSNASITLFNVVDGVFVGRGCGMLSLGAINIAYPFMMISFAIMLLISIGGCVIVAISYGMGDEKQAHQAFSHSLVLSFIVGIIITFLGTVLATPVSRLLGATDLYLKLVHDYIFFWSIFAMFQSLSVTLQAFCRNDGEPSLVATTNIVTSFLNIFLDWLFVFPLNKGIAGAAFATGVSQFVGFFIILTHYIFKRGKLRFLIDKFNLRIIFDIIYRGLPESLAQFATPLMTIFMNYVLLEYIGSTAVNSFSIMGYIACFTIAIFYGASEGLQPLFGFSFGAKQYDDLRYFFKAGLIFSIVGSGLCFLSFIVFAEPLCMIFGATGEVLEFTKENLWKYSMCFIPGSISSLISSYLYSIKVSHKAIIVNISRSFIFDTLCVLFLPKIFGVGIVWYTLFICEMIVLVIAINLKSTVKLNQTQQKFW